MVGFIYSSCSGYLGEFLGSLEEKEGGLPPPPLLIHWNSPARLVGANKQKMIYVLTLQYSTRDKILWTCAHRRNIRPFCTCIVFEYNFSYFCIIYLFYASGTHLYNYNYNHVRGRGGRGKEPHYFSSVSKKIWGLLLKQTNNYKTLLLSQTRSKILWFFCPSGSLS